MRITELPTFLLILAGLLPAAHAGDAFGPVAVRPEVRSVHVGSLELTALHDAQYVVPNDGKTFGVDAGETAVSDLLRASGLPTDRITLSVNALVVRGAGRVLLLDSGLGTKAHGVLLASLK